MTYDILLAIHTDKIKFWCFVKIWLCLSFGLLYSEETMSTFQEVSKDISTLLQEIPSLPRYMEAGYSPMGHSPVVDALLGDPLYMPPYAITVAALIKTKTQQNKLFELVTALQIAGGIPSYNLSQEIPIPLKPVPDKFMQTFSASTGTKLHRYWSFFVQISQEVTQILSVLSGDEKEWIKQNYNLFFFEKQSADADYDFFTSESPYPLKFFELASRLDLSQLTDCARKLCLIVDAIYQLREEWIHITLTEDFIWEEHGLKLIVSTKHHTTLEEDADFFIDLGGYNLIHNNAGGTKGARSAALHIDFNGHNAYHADNFVQGCGFLGVGILASFSGQNTFQADSYSQGCGFFGTGLLINLEGNNQFNLNFGGQSFALFGFSLLWDKMGHNNYLAKQGMAQSASSTLGVAFLIDNQGHNTYTAGEQGKGISRYGGIGQGGSSGVRYYPWLSNPSFYGGFSFLYVNGDQNTFKTVWLGQGSAYFLGAGLLFAEGDQDTFIADFDAQGQGLHLAAGLLYKKGKQNNFTGGWGSLGVAGDRSVGMFISIGGMNSYSGTDHSMGTSRKGKSLGAFIDFGGDNRYQFQKYSNASLLYPEAPHQWSKALFIEVGQGGSKFPENVDTLTRENNLRWGLGRHSIGIALTEHSEQDVKAILNNYHLFPNLPFPFDPLAGWMANTAYKPIKKVCQADELQKLADEILTANYDRRRQLYETLDLSRFTCPENSYNLSYLLQNPAALEEDQLNYALLWALRNKDKINLTEIKIALKYHLIASESSRRMAISLISTFWQDDAIPLLTEAMLKDPSQEVQYFASLALAKKLDANSVNILKQGLATCSEIIRFAIAKGLQESNNPYALELVLPLFEDPSFYVRRAAAMTAISLHDKRGIGQLLTELQYETVDTAENYGNNLYKTLSQYVGVDFGLDRNAWLEWWKKNNSTFQFPQ